MSEISRGDTTISRWYFGVVIILIILVYLPALFGEFVWDDILLITHNPRIKSWSGVIEAFLVDFFYGITEVPRITYYRPLITTVNVISYMLFGLKPFFFHLQNVLIHITNVMLCYILLKKILQFPSLTSLLGAVIFAIHPVNTEAVAFISGRTDLLATLFFLLAIININYQPRNPLQLLVPFVFYTLGLLAKENVVMLGGVIILINYYLSRASNVVVFWENQRRNTVRLLLIWGVITLIYLVVRFVFVKGISISGYPGGTFIATLLTMCKVFWHYVYLTILPVQQLASYQNYFVVVGSPDFYSVAQIVRTVMAAAGVGAFITIAILVFLRNNKYSLPIWWFIITLFPVLNILPFGVWAAERFLYLPTIALAILSGLLITEFECKNKKMTGLIILSIVIGCYSFLAFQRNFVWRSQESLWADVLQKNPRNDVALRNMADIKMAQEKYEEAYEYVERALKINNPNLRPLSLRIKAQAAIELKKYDEAEEILAELENIKYKKSWLHFLRGRMAQSLGDITAAEQNYILAGEIEPEFVLPRVALIRLYLQTSRRFDEVKRLALEILEFNPDYSDGYLYLGIAEERLGNIESAIANYQYACKLAPSNPEPYFYLANLYDELGTKDRNYYALALRTYGRVLLLKPDHLDAMLNMGLSYVKLGKYAEAKELWSRVLAIDPGNEAARVNLTRLAHDLLRSNR